MTPEQLKTFIKNCNNATVNLAQNMISLNHCFEEEIFADMNEMETAYWVYFRSNKEPEKEALEFFRRAKDAQFRFMDCAKKIRHLAGETICPTSDLAELFHAASTEHDEWQLARDEFYATIHDSRENITNSPEDGRDK